MFGGLLSVLVCVWFYRSATQFKLNPLQWVIGGLVVFYGIRWVWTYGVLKPVMGDTFARHGLMAGVLIELTGAVLGLACAAWFHYKVMAKQAR